MGFKREDIRYGASEEWSAYLVTPERISAPIPGVLVIQEAWGVDAHIEDITRRIASAGYVAMAPDLYSFAGARPAPLARERMSELQAFINQMPPGTWTNPELREAELAKRPNGEKHRLRESFDTMMAGLGPGSPRFEQGMAALLAAARFLRKQHPLTNGQKLGAVGFCMGGALTGLFACRDPELEAAVIYYGTSPPIELLPSVRAKVLGFYGGLDQRVNAGLPALEDGMKKHGKSFEYHVYEGAQHAFFNDTRPSYDVRAARDAFARTLDFFRRVL
jgi:carboxymethylenebutenolidase